MILFNTTFCVDNRLYDEFLSFLKLNYIPVAKSYGLHSALVMKMRGGSDDDNHTFTAALQMRAPNEDILDKFRSGLLPSLYNIIARNWGNGVAMFESKLDILHDSEK